MERVRQIDKKKEWKEISVVLTDDEGIKLLNHRYLGRHESTDVISFLYEPIPGEGDLHSAEIVVNVQCAASAIRAAARSDKTKPRPTSNRRANEVGNISRELALYIAHGCDHLAGGNDSDRTGHLQMRRRELRWLKHAEAAGLLDELVEEE